MVFNGDKNDRTVDSSEEEVVEEAKAPASPSGGSKNKPSPASPLAAATAGGSKSSPAAVAAYSSQTPATKAPVEVEEQELKEGDVVIRGRDWTRGNEDGAAGAQGRIVSSIKSGAGKRQYTVEWQEVEISTGQAVRVDYLSNAQQIEDVLDLLQVTGWIDVRAGLIANKFANKFKRAVGRHVLTARELLKEVLPSVHLHCDVEALAKAGLKKHETAKDEQGQ